MKLTLQVMVWCFDRLKAPNYISLLVKESNSDHFVGKRSWDNPPAIFLMSYNILESSTREMKQRVQLTYQEMSFTKLSLREMPAAASKIEERLSPMKSVETICKQKKRKQPYTKKMEGDTWNKPTSWAQKLEFWVSKPFQEHQERSTWNGSASNSNVLHVNPKVIRQPGKGVHHFGQSPQTSIKNRVWHCTCYCYNLQLALRFIHTSSVPQSYLTYYYWHGLMT